MRGRWVASGIACLIVLSALAPGAAASNPDGYCARAQYAIVDGLGGTTEVCVSGTPTVEPGVGPDQLSSWLVQTLEGGEASTPEVDLPVLPDANASYCPRDGQHGLVLKKDNRSSHVCASGGLDLRGDDVDQPGASLPKTGSCPYPSQGFVAEFGGTTAGVCLVWIVDLPSQLVSTDVDVDLTGCKVSDAMVAEDPSIFYGDGGVVVCVIVIFSPGAVEDPGDGPAVEVDLSPCSTQSVDPSVSVAGYGVTFCVTYNVAW